MPVAAGEREPGGVPGLVVLGSVPFFGSTRRGQCRWLRSSLRVTPAVAGGHGAGPRQGKRSGGVNHGDARAAGWRRGRMFGDPPPFPPAGGGGDAPPPAGGAGGGAGGLG